jgi:malate permease and related proteins
MALLAQIFLNVLTPVFAIVLLGYLVGPRLGLQARTLSRIAYYLLVPAFSFSVLGTAHLDVALAVKMLGYILAVQGCCALAGFLVARALRRPAPMVAAYILIAVFANVGNFGIAIVRFALGEAGTIPATIYFVAISSTSFALGVGAANFVRGGSLTAITSVLKTPGVVAVIPALALNFLNIPLPPAIIRPLDLLAGAMIPVMLLGLGVQFADSGLPKLTLDMVVASGVRLIVAPALAALLAVIFGITGLERGAGVIQASTPAAVFAAIIALENDLLADFVTATVLLSTALSVVTMAVVLYFL